jgi:heme/copper-type cytochrome/quinol oxidase subunit 3
MAKENIGTTAHDESEYRQVRRDLIFVIVLNLLFFAALLALYFVNRASGVVDKSFAQILKF